jgi:hypothetical protein
VSAPITGTSAPAASVPITGAFASANWRTLTGSPLTVTTSVGAVLRGDGGGATVGVAPRVDAASVAFAVREGVAMPTRTVCVPNGEVVPVAPAFPVVPVFARTDMSKTPTNPIPIQAMTGTRFFAGVGGRRE